MLLSVIVGVHNYLPLIRVKGTYVLKDDKNEPKFLVFTKYYVLLYEINKFIWLAVRVTDFNLSF